MLRCWGPVQQDFQPGVVLILSHQNGDFARQHGGFRMVNSDLLTIWLVVDKTPLKNMEVNWDDKIPNRWENSKNGNQTTNHIIAT